MSGLEIVGAIVSVGQIISQVIKTSRSIRELGQSVVEFQRHQDDLCVIISATQSIQKQPYLHSTYITSYLQKLLIRLETLKTALRRYAASLPRTPFQKIKWALRCAESKNFITKQFSALESDKSTLLLCMSTFSGHRSSCRLSLTENEMPPRRTNTEVSRVENASTSITRGADRSQALATTSHTNASRDIGQYKYDSEDSYANDREESSQKAPIDRQSRMQQTSVQEQKVKYRELVMEGKKTITEDGGVRYYKNIVGKKGLMANRPNGPSDQFNENEAQGGILLDGNTEQGETVKLAELLYKADV
ncbi:hypothetical protein EV356DRAFT_499046 [Viridothelium virens]|uniref:Fungal N-terminal domain-containing protein n=1 Tax=Viridothelium virens TaxID=1048519 RepID=A0A6A6GS20_VIRVR|nr:hypothetical protein EV356DRAFT_499046 [Viridothelium virens]